MKKVKWLLKSVAFSLSFVIVIQILPLSTLAAEINNKKILEPVSLENPEELMPDIVEEVVELRSEYTKHFRCEDGSYVAAMYNEPVHYQKGSEWKNIRNELKVDNNIAQENKSVDAKYTITETSTPITFPENINTGKITINKNGNVISFGAKGNTKASSGATLSEPKELVSASIERSQAETLTDDKHQTKLSVDKGSSAVSYSDAFENVSLEYEISSSIVKESIVINERSDSYRYEFSIDFGNFIPVYDNLTGGIYIYESSQSSEPIMAITPPYMYDADYETSDAVTMELVKNTSDYTLIVEANKKWINSIFRKFPIVIDPTFVLDVGVNSIDDIHVNQNYPNQSYKLDYQLEVGKNSNNVYRTYIKYDLPSLPDCSVVTDAKLTLVQNWARNFDATELYLNVYQCNADWDFNTITWNNQPIQNLSSATIVDYTNYVGGMSAEYNLNITKIVKDWYENGKNYGLMLASSDESVNEKTSFYSSRNIVNNEPIITIQYVNNTGLEDYWTYDSFSLSNAGSTYVNTYNGALTYIHNDVKTNGLITPLNISHVYLTDDKTATGTFGNMNFGKGFKLNVIEKIEEADIDVLGIYYPYKYIDADGTVHYFIRNSLLSNQFYYEFGSDIILTSTSSGYVLSMPDGSSKEFNSDGFLTKATDTNGNTITYTYSNGKITQVTDGGGLSVYLSYNSDSTLNYITDSVGRKTYYHYNSSGQLDRITYPDSTTTTYSYDNNSLLNEIRAASGSKATLTYKAISNPGNVFHRVSSYSLYGEDSTTVYDTVNFNYRTCDTYITNTRTEDNVVLAFDNSGRVTNQTVNGKTVSVAKYNSSGNKNNSISFASNTFDVSYNSFKRGTSKLSTDLFSKWEISSDRTSNNTIENSTERTNIQKKSLKVQRQGTAGTVTAEYTTWDVEPNKTYTVSMYVSIVDSLECGDVHLNLTASQGDRPSNLVELSSVEGASIKTTENQWQMISATITTPENTDAITITCGMYNAIGTVYFDAFQIEEALVPSRMNLLENGDLEKRNYSGGTDEWNGLYGGDSRLSDNGNENDYLLIKGSPSEERQFKQTVELSGKAGDILVFGASARALCSSSGNNGTRFFGIKVNLYDNNYNVVQSVSVNFDEQTYNTWQTIMSSIKANYDYIQAELVLCYYREVNEAHFDNVFMYRDYFGTSYTYNDQGRIEKAESDNGQAVEYYRSGLDGVGLDINTVTAYANGQVTQTAGYSYDSKHNITAATDSNGITTSYTYNSKGLPLTMAVSAGDGLLTSSTSYTYTADNNYLKSVTDATGSTTEYTYNSKGLVSKVTDPNGNETEYEYDPDTDALVSVSNPSDDLGNPSTQFEYDDAGRISMIDTGITEWYYYYDVFGKTDMAEDNFGTTLFLNYYDEKHRLQTQEYFNYDYVDFTYDDEDRVTGESYNGVLTYEYQYSNDGMLGKVVDRESGEEWSYQYDLMNRPTFVSSDDGRNISYEYNGKNELSRFKVSDSGSKLLETTYTYDNSGRVTDTQIPSMQGTPSQTYSYDLLGRNDRFINFYNGTDSVEATYSYRVVNGNQTGQVKTLTYYGDNDSFVTKRYDYQYDANGNITQISYVDMPLVKYYYDGLNRLIREDNIYINKTVVYAYSKSGNILSKTEYELTFEAELGEAVNTVTSQYANGRWRDSLSGYDGDTDFSYDASGNPLSYRGYTMSWAKGRQLRSVSKSGLSMQFKYNQSGIRTSKTVNGVKTEYTYVGDMLVSQKTGSEVINFAYTAGGAPLGFTYNGTPYFYLLNLQGDIISIYDSTGEIVVNYTHDTWGKLISISGSMADTIGVKNPLRYRGYYYDTETSLYYLQSRYYDPETCRFINADAYVIAGNDYIQGTNRYAYCYNNPVMYSDPSGYAVDPATKNAIDTIFEALGLIFEYGLSLGYSEDEIFASVSDFLSRTKPLYDNAFELAHIMTLGVSVMTGDAWWTNIYSDASFMKDLVSVMKTDFFVDLGVKGAASFAASVIAEMIPEFLNPLNSNIDLLAALGKHTFVEMGGFAISASGFSVAATMFAVNPVLGVVTGAAWMFLGNIAWDEITKEI